MKKEILILNDLIELLEGGYPRSDGAADELAKNNAVIPLGLILSELVSNSLKYGFPESRKGDLIIEFYCNDHEYNLIVNNKGIGIPKRA